MARTQIAVLDHSGLNRKQAVTKQGTPRYKAQWSKVTIMEPQEKTYIEEILVEIRSGERGKWKYEGTKKKSIAKKDRPGINFTSKGQTN